MKAPVILGTAALVLSPLSHAQENRRLPRTEQSLLQPQHETEAEPTGLNPKLFATGDWLSQRTRLYDCGVDVFAFYNAIVNGNIAGGRDQGHATYVHDIWVGLKLDLERLSGWRGAQLAISGIDRYGEDLTTKYIGSIYSVQQMVGGQSFFLYQVYLQQKLFEDRLTLKLGRYGASDDFNTSPLYGYSLNNGINGNIRNVLFNTRFSAYPFATWAGAVFFDPTPELHFKLGAFQVTQNMFDPHEHGVDFSFHGSDGYLAIMQAGWTPEFGKTEVVNGDGKSAVTTRLSGYPGHYWVGATWSQWDFYQRFTGGFEDHSYGFYVHADQMLTKEAPGSDEGLTAFVASGYYPQKEISIVPFQINAGLNYRGLIPRRPDDHTALHFIYGKLSHDYARSVRVPGRGAPESEKVVELAHRFQVTPWSYFQPDVQWVINPGGTGDIPDAVVVGAQFGLTF